MPAPGRDCHRYRATAIAPRAYSSKIITTHPVIAPRALSRCNSAEILGRSSGDADGSDDPSAADRIMAGRITTMPTRNASSAAAPPDPNARPIGGRTSPPAAAPESRWNSQKPETSVMRATIGRITGSRRRISAAINFPASGPASASAGIKKNVWNAIMPTHNAPKKTWAKRRTSITCDSLPRLGAGELRVPARPFALRPDEQFILIQIANDQRWAAPLDALCLDRLLPDMPAKSANLVVFESDKHAAVTRPIFGLWPSLIQDQLESEQADLHHECAALFFILPVQ